MKISVFGLGRLGSPLAAVLSRSGHSVLGYDPKQAAVEAVNAGRAPCIEPRLQEFIDASEGRLRATSDPLDCVLETDATFVVVPTPSEPDGAFSLAYAREAFETIGRALAHKTGYHLVVLTSTVMPRSMAGALVPAIEKVSARACGQDLGVCYSPQFIALGSVVHNLLQPDFLLVGESDEQAGELLTSIWERVFENSPRISRMNFVNAEICKLAVNTYVTTKISYANMLSELCERLPGADVDTVTRTLGQDRRIGDAYIRGATGYGGPCFPRDNVAFAKIARDVGARADLAEATDRTNERQVSRVAELVSRYAEPGSSVAILGLSYKPDTNVIDRSQGLELAATLVALGYEVRAFDPMAMEHAKGVLGDGVSLSRSATECLESADLGVITTPWSEFAKLDATALRQPPRCVIDCWRVLDCNRFPETALVYLGRGARSD